MITTLLGRCESTNRIVVGTVSDEPILGKSRTMVRAQIGAVVIHSGLTLGSEVLALNLLDMGYSLANIVSQMTEGTITSHCHQFALIKANGMSQTSTSKTLGANAYELTGTNYVAISIGDGSADMVKAMVGSYIEGVSETRLEYRLATALAAAVGAAPIASRVSRSASLAVYGAAPYPEVDMRVDLSDDALDQIRIILHEQHLMDLYFAERRRNPKSTDFSDHFIARMKLERTKGSS